MTPQTKAVNFKQEEELFFETQFQRVRTLKPSEQSLTPLWVNLMLDIGKEAGYTEDQIRALIDGKEPKVERSES